VFEDNEAMQFWAEKAIGAAKRKNK
jgi:hypothetical protein